MFKLLTFFCIIAVALANPGILSPSLGIVSSPTIISAPSIGILRTAPVATLGVPLGLSGGLVSGGLVSSGLVSGGLVSNGLITKGLVSNGLVSGGIISGGLVSGKLIR